jgi:3-methyladenine DNA glycosylase/8-oxoguanine DNA glycosylase
MSRVRYNRATAAAHLCAQCRPLADLIRRVGPLKLRVARTTDLFHALSAAIIYQQLSGKAARTIYGRFCALFDDGTPGAEGALRLRIPALRGAGLSNNKALAVRDLAGKCSDGTLPPLRRLSRMGDEDVIEKLCQVRGIGPWSAQMFLMFNLGRPDVMPATDLGVQKGVQHIYDLPETPSPEQVLERTRHLAPYRSAASWYFWRAADTELMT